MRELDYTVALVKLWLHHGATRDETATYCAAAQMANLGETTIDDSYFWHFNREATNA